VDLQSQYFYQRLLLKKWRTQHIVVRLFSHILRYLDISVSLNFRINNHAEKMLRKSVKQEIIRDFTDDCSAAFTVAA